MRVWTVHTPPEALRLARDDQDMPAAGRRARPPVLVREGFAWLAFFFALPWLLWHRLWLETVIYLGLVAILAALVPAGAALPVALALQFLLGAHARDLQRWSLARRGYVQAHVVAERDADRALLRLIEAQPDLAPALARAALA
jgi:hypothetical protein